MASAQQYKYPGVEGRKPSATVARKIGAQLNEAMGFIMEVAPGAGSYSTQANFLLEDWQDAQWGSNYPKLLRIKRRYDPANFFRVHHGEESEER